MAKLTKRQKEVLAKVEKNKLYSIDEASSLVKETNTYKKLKKVGQMLTLSLLCQLLWVN